MAATEELKAYRAWVDELAEPADPEDRLSYEELVVRVRHLVEVVGEQEHALENYRTCGHPNDYDEMVARVRELSALLEKSVSERERELLRELDLAKKRHDKSTSKAMGHGNAVLAKERQLERLQLLYEELCDRAPMPWPPCPHGLDPHRCIRCVANWLGRERVTPDIRTNSGDPPQRRKARRQCELCGKPAENGRIYCSTVCQAKWEQDHPPGDI